MSVSKADRLYKLQSIVAVPNFFVITKNSILKSLDKKKKYMVRSSTKEEDQKDYSHAGLSTTIGPIPSYKVKSAVRKIFSLNPSCEIIIQEFVDGINGVAFCFSKKKIYLEYSSFFSGVTAGKVNPFVAVLPTKIKKYSKLQNKFEKIVDKFGPCDVEFVGVENPCFVQVRPITRNFSFNIDSDAVMRIQELSKNWIENDFCKILPERKNNSSIILSSYLDSLVKFHRDFSKKNIIIPENPFLRVGERYYIDESILNQCKLGFFGIIRLMAYWKKNRYKIEKDLPDNLLDALQISLCLSAVHELLKEKSIIYLREKYREHIDRLITKYTHDSSVQIVSIKSKNKLNSILKLDTNKKIWLSNPFSFSKGIEVVSGSLDGPYAIINNASDAIKKDSVIVTPQLFPKLGKEISNIKGIICEGGALTSHVAILAREHNVPLTIQMTDARKIFSESKQNNLNQ